MQSFATLLFVNEIECVLAQGGRRALLEYVVPLAPAAGCRR